MKFLNYKRKEIIAEERRKKIEKKKEAARTEMEIVSADVGGAVAGPSGAAARPSGAQARPSLPPSAARRNAKKTKQFAKR